jgi:hypothetical protein
MLALTMVNPVYLISTTGARGCDRSAEDAYSSASPDPTFAFVGGPCCPTLDFVIVFWIMITFYTLLTSLSCMIKYLKEHVTEFKYFQCWFYLHQCRELMILHFCVTQMKNEILEFHLRGRCPTFTFK